MKDALTGRFLNSPCVCILVYDKPLLAKIMGSSVEKLNSSYIRKEVTVDLGLMYFGIYPPGYSGQIVMGEELITALRGRVDQPWVPTPLPTSQPAVLPPASVSVAPKPAVPIEVKVEVMLLSVPAPVATTPVVEVSALPDVPVTRPGRDAALAVAAEFRKLQQAYAADKERIRQERKRLKRQRRHR